jgi:hypothetical protein
MLEECRRRYGDVFSLKAWPPFEDFTVVADPDVIKKVFTASPAQLYGGLGNRILEPVVGPNSILILDEDRHLRERRLMLPSFHGDIVRNYGRLVEEEVERELVRWPADEPFAIKPAMSRISLRVILRAVFGVEEARRLGRLEELYTEVLNTVGLPLMVPALRRDLGGRSPWARFKKALAASDELLYDEIARRREAADTSRTDILSLLLQARYDDDAGGGMTDHELRDELATVLLAGHETTALSLSWTFERLSRTPRVLARLEEEVASGDDEDYLDCVVKEGLRARTPLSYAMRSVMQPIELGGYEVPAGATIGVSIRLMHQRADLYPNPAAFWPERFADKRTETYTWVPFGGGVRRCIGLPFAMYEMRVVLRTVLRHRRLVPTLDPPERMRRNGVTFTPHRGAVVRLATLGAPAPGRADSAQKAVAATS